MRVVPPRVYGPRGRRARDDDPTRVLRSPTGGVKFRKGYLPVDFPPSVLTLETSLVHRKTLTKNILYDHDTKLIPNGQG